MNVMVEPGASPATYEPKPEQLTALSRSAAYFSIGLPFENVWLDRIAEANPEMRIVNTAAGIERLPIEALERRVEETLSGVETRKFLVFHPSWGYFARDFGLEQIAIEVGGQEPSARELAEIIAVAQEENIRVVFAQPEFSAEDATTIAEEIGGEVIMVSPLATDWLDNMQTVADTFAEALGR